MQQELVPLDIKRVIQEAAIDFGNTDTLSVYGAVSTRGTFKPRGHGGCHVDVLYIPKHCCKKHTAYLLSLTPQRRLDPRNREADIAYYRWLLGPESPYTSITKRFNPDPEFALDYGIVIGELETAPNNLIYHFFIATRLIYEYNLGQIWYSFIKEGLHPAMAFLATYTPSMGGASATHSAFPPQGVTAVWIQNFGNATPVRLDAMYPDSSNHQGADNTWGELVRYSPAPPYTPGKTCWDEWYNAEQSELFRASKETQIWTVWGSGPAKKVPNADPRYVPKDRESGIKILLQQQEKLFDTSR